jgi:glutathione synthase/RimK-type ligase-like ATP-grasp enzyme
VIKDAKPSDSGIYVCEVNSNPILRSFHKLSGEYRMQKAMLVLLTAENTVFWDVTTG